MLYQINPTFCITPTYNFAEVAKTLSHLNLSDLTSSKPRPINTSSHRKPKAAPVADSWEDASGSDTETEDSNPSNLSYTSSKNSELSPISTIPSSEAVPNPPPPTPASPTPFEFPSSVPFSPNAISSRDEGRLGEGIGRGDPDRRPDKTTSVATRLISAGLGIRAPRRTEEEREYDKVMREKERKRRAEEKDRERREKEEAEERKRSVWED